MRNLPLIIVTILYIGQAGVYIYTKDYAQAVILGGYAFANFGLIATL